MILQKISRIQFCIICSIIQSGSSTYLDIQRELNSHGFSVQYHKSNLNF